MGIKELGASPAPGFQPRPSPRGGTVTKRIKAQQLIISQSLTSGPAQPRALVEVGSWLFTQLNTF